MNNRRMYWLRRLQGIQTAWTIFPFHHQLFHYLTVKVISRLASVVRRSRVELEALIRARFTQRVDNTAIWVDNMLV